MIVFGIEAYSHIFTGWKSEMEMSLNIWMDGEDRRIIQAKFIWKFIQQ